MTTARTSKNDLATEWENAWKEKNVSELKNLLLQNYIPDNLETVLHFDSKETPSLTLMDILLDNNSLDEDVECFKIADKFLLKGAKLPGLYQEEKNFKTKEEYFIHLVHCNHDLYIALRKNNKLIQEQDSKKQTLLHHAARIGDDLDADEASLIHYLLFNVPQVNFNLEDQNGNTPLHIAALNADKFVTCKYIFPNYLKAAFISGFDFEALNHQGQTILHIAARTTFDNINNVLQVIHCVPNIPLDTLSSSGTSALYYAINHLRLKEARTLLEYKANPKIFGKDAEGVERNPLTMITEHLEMTNKKMIQLEKSEGKDDSLYDKIEFMYLNDLRKEIMSLKKDIENHSQEKTCTGIIIKWLSSIFLQSPMPTNDLLENFQQLKR